MIKLFILSFSFLSAAGGGEGAQEQSWLYTWLLLPSPGLLVFVFFLLLGIERSVVSGRGLHNFEGDLRLVRVLELCFTLPGTAAEKSKRTTTSTLWICSPETTEKRR